MNLDKYDLYILSNLRSYKAISMFQMIFGAVGIVFGGYLIVLRGERGLNIALLGASIVVSVSGYLSICYIEVLRKIIRKYGYLIQQDKIACPKCSSEFVVGDSLIKESNSMSNYILKDTEKRSAYKFLTPFTGLLLSFLIGGLLIWIIRVYFR